MRKHLMGYVEVNIYIYSSERGVSFRSRLQTVYHLNYIQHFWVYKVEEKLYLQVCEQTTLNTTDIKHIGFKSTFFQEMASCSLLDIY
jgi:hypothetical protein